MKLTPIAAILSFTLLPVFGACYAELSDEELEAESAWGKDYGAWDEGMEDSESWDTKSTTYALRLKSITCFNHQDAAGKDEPYIKLNGSTVWSGGDFYNGKSASLTHISPRNFTSSISIELWEDDKWPSNDDYLGEYRVFGSIDAGMGVLEADFGGTTYYYEIQYEVDIASVCGDGYCESGETSYSCRADCGYCGDGVCYGSETASSCSADCGGGGGGCITDCCLYGLYCPYPM